MFLRRLARAAAPIASPHAYRGQSASTSIRLITWKYLLAYADMLLCSLNPDKWIEFKLQDKAKVSHNTQLYRFSFDPSTKLGLDVASCLVTRYPLAPDDEGKNKICSSAFLEYPCRAVDTRTWVCGPPGMVKHISGEKAKDWTQGELTDILKELGYTEDMVYKF
ncbi:hypothetical protein POM88_014345 [Heracleum sosnowskyi]|uniref:Uncharacterized protein n=1 Tax=Heracleum sosnowskyi TaxID=360622 RepID=A0AAD8J082_9APIA|nr:hypothetical protein POM88_014345 [Heracleum sosnowskyi]